METMRLTAPLQERVFRALDQARDNGYDQICLPSTEVTWDLLTLVTDLEEEDFVAVKLLVEEWQQNR